MKKLGFRWVTALAASVILLASAACSDDKTETVYITNPALQDISAKPGDTGTIDFTATGNWTITTDSPEWLTLGSSTGAAGAQKVSYTVTDTNIAFDVEDKAKVTLATEGGEFSCTITRAAKERTIAFTDGEDQPAAAVVIAYDEGASSDPFHGKVEVLANFDWKIVSLPDWITASASEGTAGESLTVWFNFAATVTTTGRDGEIVFADESGSKFKQSLPVKFYGAEPSIITTTLPYSMKFTPEAFVYANAWDEAPSTEKEKEFSITAVDGGYKMVVLTQGYSAGTLAEMDLSNEYSAWITLHEIQTRAEFTTRNYRIGVQENLTGPHGMGAAVARWAEIYLIPANLYTKLTGISGYGEEGEYTLIMGGDDGDSVNPDFENYMFCRIDQDAPAGFKFESSDVTLEDYSQSQGFPMFGAALPAAAGTVTIRVSLPADKAGQYPDGVTGTSFTVRLESQTYNPDTQQMETSNGVDVPVVIKNIADDNLSYDLEIALPKNSGPERSGSIAYKDEYNDTIAGLDLVQAAGN